MADCNRLFQLRGKEGRCVAALCLYLRQRAVRIKLLKCVPFSVHVFILMSFLPFNANAFRSPKITSRKTT